MRAREREGKAGRRAGGEGMTGRRDGKNPEGNVAGGRQRMGRKEM